MEINKKKKKGSQAKNDKCMAKLLLERRKRVESGTGTSVPEIRVVGSYLNMEATGEENSTMGTPLKSRRQGGNMLLFNRRSAGARPCVQKSECITIVVLNTKNCVFC